MVKPLGYIWVFSSIKYQIVYMSILPVYITICAFPSLSVILLQALITYILDYYNNLSVFKMKHEQTIIENLFILNTY